MATSSPRDSILLIGASGRTGICVLRYLCAASVPVIACVRRANALPQEPRLTQAEVAISNLEQPGTFAPLIERAAHVIYVAGSARNSLSPGAWQVEVESLAACIAFAERSGFEGRWIYAGCTDPDPAQGITWAESRWREMKREAEQAIVGSANLNYFILRSGRVTAPIVSEPRVRVSQGSSGAADAEVPCNVLAFLMTGVALAGAAYRSEATIRVDPAGGGMRLQEAVQSFAHLRRDYSSQATAAANPFKATVHRR